MRVDDLFSSADPAGLRRLTEAVEQTRFFHSREEYGLARQEGEPLSVNLSVSRVHTTPEPLGLVVVRDVTERRRSEAVKKTKEAAEAASRPRGSGSIVGSYWPRTTATTGG